MAVYSGNTIGTTKSPDLNARDFLSTNLQTADEGFLYNPNHALVPAPTSGERQYVIQQFRSNKFSGKSVNNPPVLYNKYLIVKDDVVVPSVDAGVVGVNESLIFGLWNGYDRKDTLVAITISQPDAISVSLGAEVGDVWGNYSEKQVGLLILPTAPPNVDCEITFEFSSGEIVVISITALTGSVLLFRPQTQYIEFIQFLTDVITSRNGTEQRRAMRLYPRHHMAINYTEFDNTESNKMKNALTGKPAARLGNGFWQFMRYADSQPQSGDFTVYVDTSLSAYEVGKNAIVYDEGTTTFDVREIESYDANSITFTQEIEHNYMKAIIAPYYFMQTVTPIKYIEFISHTQFDLEGMMTDVIDIEPYTFASQYNGVDVLPYDCNIFKQGSTIVTVENSYDEFDGDTGVFSKSSRWDSSKRVIKLGVHATSRQACYDLRRIVYALRGRQKAIWVPSMNDDFAPTETLENQIFECAENGYATYVYNDETNFKHLGFYRNGETPIYAEVTNAEEDAGIQTITIDQTLPAIQPEDVKVSMLYRCRLHSDAVEIEWVSPDECFCILPFITVKE